MKLILVFCLLLHEGGLTSVFISSPQLSQSDTCEHLRSAIDPILPKGCMPCKQGVACETPCALFKPAY
uniref:Secreted protein n=1 Tax=Mesocestoides corti TaxID=53468 RepID=A0A5K3FTT3_MESCO